MASIWVSVYSMKLFCLGQVGRRIEKLTFNLAKSTATVEPGKDKTRIDKESIVELSKTGLVTICSAHMIRNVERKCYSFDATGRITLIGAFG